MIQVSVIVVAFGDQPLLESCIQSCLNSVNVDLQILIVDNGCSNLQEIIALKEDPRIRVLEPGSNLGFAAGCNYAASRADQSRELIFLNPDVILENTCLSSLGKFSLANPRNLVTGQIRLFTEPDLLNCCGNLFHPLGISWSNLYRKPVASAPETSDVPLISGALFAVSQDFWNELGGFDETYFAYYEDVEISWRARELGGSITCLSTAIGFHDHEFSRHKMKMYLLDRNRLLTVLTHYQISTLFLLLPIAFAFELALSFVALKQRWFKSRIRSVLWVIRNLKIVVSKRKHIQKSRRLSDQVLFHNATTYIEISGYPVNSVFLKWQRPIHLYIKFCSFVIDRQNTKISKKN